MNLSILVRLIVYFATITLLMALIGWTAHTSWQRTGDLQRQISVKQWQSFQIANRLQQGILGLNNRMLRYAANRNDADWSDFAARSQELGQWLNEQPPSLISDAERPFLDRINAAYGDYLAGAAALHEKIFPTRQSVTRLVEFANL